jgi:hypothetical protein
MYTYEPPSNITLLKRIYTKKGSNNFAYKTRPCVFVVISSITQNKFKKKLFDFIQPTFERNNKLMGVLKIKIHKV